MAGGALRGALSAWLGLIALQAVSTKGGSGRIVELANSVSSFVDRALDPTIPAIPDLRSGETWGTAGPVGTFGTPGTRPTGRPAGPFVPPQR
jgi:hypothetical protein